MTIFLILGGHLSMSRTWAHPLFCSFSDSSTFIRNMPWMHFFEASSNLKHNIQILQHATQSLPIPGTLQHLDLTLCHSLTVHTIHQVNLISQFLKKNSVFFCVLKKFQLFYGYLFNTCHSLWPLQSHSLPSSVHVPLLNATSTIYITVMFLIYAK